MSYTPPPTCLTPRLRLVLRPPDLSCTPRFFLHPPLLSCTRPSTCLTPRRPRLVLHPAPDLSYTSSCLSYTPPWLVLHLAPHARARRQKGQGVAKTWRGLASQKTVCAQERRNALSHTISVLVNVAGDPGHLFVACVSAFARVGIIFVAALTSIFACHLCLLAAVAAGALSFAIAWS